MQKQPPRGVPRKRCCGSCKATLLKWCSGSNFIEKVFWKLQSNFIEITLRHGCSPVSLLHIFRTPFTKNASRRLLLIMWLAIFFFFFEKSKNINTSCCNYNDSLPLSYYFYHLQFNNVTCETLHLGCNKYMNRHKNLHAINILVHKIQYI